MATLSYSNELLLNYLQSEIVSPNGKFEALQTPDGHSLLFSIGTDSRLYMTEERVGNATKTGWLKNDICAALYAEYPTATTKTFAVSQYENHACLLVALTINGKDNAPNNVNTKANDTDLLFIAKGFERSITGEITVTWEALPYDNERAHTAFNISQIYVMQTKVEPLIVVDVDLSNTDDHISRFYIDVNNWYDKNKKWLYYALPTNIEADSPTTPVTICAGRRGGEYINGLYTLGTNAGKRVIIYQPLYKEVAPNEPGLPVQLKLPNGKVPNAIATVPSLESPGTEWGDYTDLFITSEDGGLYFFSAARQNEYNYAEEIIEYNALFKTMSELYVNKTYEKIVVWGRNTDQNVFYTQCGLTFKEHLSAAQQAELTTVLESKLTPKQIEKLKTLSVSKIQSQLYIKTSPAKIAKLTPTQLAKYEALQDVLEPLKNKFAAWKGSYEGRWIREAGAWTYPMPIAYGVQQISPYTNCVNGGNTYFAHIGKDTLKKVFQDPVTTCWQVQDIQLPVLKQEEPTEVNSYTTKFTIKDETGTGVPNGYMAISSAYRIPTYINNHYYTLDVNPIVVPASSGGTVTVIQPVNEDLQGATLSVQVFLDANYNTTIEFPPVETTTEATTTSTETITTTTETTTARTETTTTSAETTTVSTETTTESTGTSGEIMKADPPLPPKLVPQGGSFVFNPMDKATNKLLALDDSTKLSTAEYPSDDTGKTTEKLVTDTSTANLNATATNMQQLGDINSSITPTDPKMVAKMTPKMRLACIAHRAYVSHEGGSAVFKTRKANKSKTPQYKTTPQYEQSTPQYKGGAPITEEESANATYVAAGDVFSRLKARRAERIEIRHNAVEKVWEFVCEFAEGFMKFVIDTVDKVVGAIQAVLEAVGTVIRGLVQFVKFLFSWDDIKITAHVYSKMIKVFLNDAILSVDGDAYKAKVGEMIGIAQAVISEWSGIPLDPTAPKNPPKTVPIVVPCPSCDSATASSSDPAAEDTSCTDSYLQEQLTNNMEGGEMDDVTSPLSDDNETALQQLFNSIEDLVKGASADIQDAFRLFYTELLEDLKFRRLTILEVLQKAIGIVANLVLELAQELIDFAVDVLVIMINGIWDLLKKGLWIPILSPILRRFFGIEIPSAIDLLCYVMAMPATMTYKVLNRTAPYSEKDAKGDIVPNAVAQSILALNTEPTTKEAAAATLNQLYLIFNPPAMKVTGTADRTSNAKEGLYITAKAGTGMLDVIAGVFYFFESLPASDYAHVIKIISFCNNLVKVTIDKFMSFFATPSPTIVTDEKYPGVIACNYMITQLHIVEKAVFYGRMLMGRSTMSDRCESTINACLYFCLFPMPITTVYEVVSGSYKRSNPNEDVTASGLLGCMDAGIQFCMIGNALLSGVMNWLPEKSVNTAGLKLVLGVVGGGVAGIVSPGLRLGEIFVEGEEMFPM